MLQGPAGPQGMNGEQGPKGAAGTIGRAGYGYELDRRSISFYGSSTGPTGPIGFFSSTVDINDVVFNFGDLVVGVLYIFGPAAATCSVISGGTRAAGQHYTFINKTGSSCVITFPMDMQIDGLNDNIPGSSFTFTIPAGGFLRLIYDGTQFYSFTK
jgi:hypothetical protein